MDINEILQEWFETKQKIKKLERNQEKYRKSVSKVMDKKGVDRLYGSEYTVDRRHSSRSYVSKNSVPADIWDKYSNTYDYDSFYLKPNKKNENKN